MVLHAVSMAKFDSESELDELNSCWESDLEMSPKLYAIEVGSGPGPKHDYTMISEIRQLVFLMLCLESTERALPYDYIMISEISQLVFLMLCLENIMMHRVVR